MPRCMALTLALLALLRSGYVDALDDDDRLLSTLFPFRLHACDRERLRLRCPYGTVIMVRSARYGRGESSVDKCPAVINRWSNSPQALLPTQEAIQEDTNCNASTSMQVLLEHCQYERTCTVRANQHTFREDPCPGTSKYLEVAHICKPDEFQTRITCEGDEMLLVCGKGKRLAIHSAMFGRNSQGNLECPFTEFVLEGECRSACSLDLVIQRCHGKRRCAIPANENTFGNPCGQGIPKFLSVMYACVQKRILKEMRDSEEHGGGVNSFCNGEGALDIDTEETDDRDDHLNNSGRGHGHGRRTTTTTSTTPSFLWHFTSEDPSTVNGDNMDTNWEADRDSELERLREELGLEIPDDNDREGDRENGRDRPRGDNNGRGRGENGRGHDGGDNNRDPGDSNGHRDPYWEEEETELGLTVDDTTSVICLTEEGTANPNCVTPDPAAIQDKSAYIGFLHDWVNTVTFIQDNMEKFFLYLTLGIFTGLILILLVIIARLLQTRKRHKRKAKLDITDPVPNSSHPAEDFTLLDNEHDTDGIEILSINHNNRPPPFPTDTANRSLNNYYG